MRTHSNVGDYVKIFQTNQAPLNRGGGVLVSHRLTVLVVFNCKDKYLLNTFTFTSALSVLQNGSIPTFMSQDVQSELFGENPVSPCIASLRSGLDALGVYQVC